MSCNRTSLTVLLNEQTAKAWTTARISYSHIMSGGEQGYGISFAVAGWLID